MSDDGASAHRGGSRCAKYAESMLAREEARSERGRKMFQKKHREMRLNKLKAQRGDGIERQRVVCHRRRAIARERELAALEYEHKTTMVFACPSTPPHTSDVVDLTLSPPPPRKRRSEAPHHNTATADERRPPRTPKHASLDAYYDINSDVVRMEAELRILSDEVKLHADQRNLVRAYHCDQARLVLADQLDMALVRRDEAVARVICADPVLLAMYDNARDPTKPSFRPPVNIATLFKKYVTARHCQCVRLKNAAKVADEKRKAVGVKIDDASRRHDGEGPEMDALRAEMQQLEAEECKIDAQRHAEFIDISIWCPPVRQYVRDLRPDESS
ncbi:Aste57867_5648 [Aphanomyces stellatus]|uniref:Aste57867_5648 protein n=1 Tax=Aphanomyces stellatus TaxID=120398 RepID=A0A485KEV5_9STRA|nr:hypothetical protein As57867_005635 [Aphanomyces stellatus]VFT82694.1 Aste57867_5648 [Aphanomyces stellatus]